MILVKIYSKRKGTIEERTFETMMEAQTREMPMKSLPSFSNGKISREYVEELLKKLNA